MSPSKPQYSKSVSRILSLLSAYRDGKLLAYITPGARLERPLPPLEQPGDVALVQQLLANADDEQRVVEIAQKAGSRRAVRLLQHTVMHPAPPGYVRFRIRPCAQRGGGKATWILLQIDLSETGMTLHSLFWADVATVPVASAVAAKAPPEPSDRLRLVESNYPLQVSDAIGTRYSWLVSSSGTSSVAIEEGSKVVTRLVTKDHQTWCPGPPQDAAKLIISPPDSIHIATEADPTPLREIPIGGPAVVVQLSEWRRIVRASRWQLPT